MVWNWNGHNQIETKQNVLFYFKKFNDKNKCVCWYTQQNPNEN